MEEFKEAQCFILTSKLLQIVFYQKKQSNLRHLNSLLQMFLHKHYGCSIKIYPCPQIRLLQRNLNKHRKQFLVFHFQLFCCSQIFLKNISQFRDRTCRFHSSFLWRINPNIPYHLSSEKYLVHVSYHFKINLHTNFHLRKFIFLCLRVCHFASYPHKLFQFSTQTFLFLKTENLKILLDKKIHHKRSKFHLDIKLILLQHIPKSNVLRKSIFFPFHEALYLSTLLDSMLPCRV